MSLWSVRAVICSLVRGVPEHFPGAQACLVECVGFPGSEAQSDARFSSNTTCSTFLES